MRLTVRPCVLTTLPQPAFENLGHETEETLGSGAVGILRRFDPK